METGPPRQAGKKARHGEQKSLPRKVRASPCRSTLLIPERTVKGDLIDSGGKTDERVGVRGPGSTGWTGNPGLGLGPGPQEVESVDPSLLPTSRFLGRAGNSKGGKTCAEDTTQDSIGGEPAERHLPRAVPSLRPRCLHGDPERLGHSRFSGELTCPRSA